MPRKSTIKTLPPEILAEVNRLFVEDLATIDQIVEHLQELGHPRARSSLGRYKQNLDQVAEKLRRSRDMAEALVKEIGPAATEGKTGRLLVEILQSLAFEHLLNKVEGEDTADPIDLARLAKALKDMASAQKIDVDRELKIRQETARRAASAAEKVAGEKGLSADTVEDIKAAILGVPKQ